MVQRNNVEMKTCTGKFILLIYYIYIYISNFYFYAWFLITETISSIFISQNFPSLAYRKLETNLKKTVDELAAVETTIRNLKDAIWEKDAPNKVRNEDCT